jgi:membrane-associated phospholipid phosphatase
LLEEVTMRIHLGKSQLRLGGVALALLAVAARSAAAQEPEPAPHFEPSQHFTIDPVVDGVLIVGGVGFAQVLGLILSTNEIKPNPPGDPANLLSIDRVAVTQTIDPHAGTYSTIGLYSAYGYAALDSILAGARDGRHAFLIDAILYSESIAITWAFTDATKIGVRRPRPIDYVNCGAATANSSSCDSTDLQLSFFSGHAATTATIAATASYLAFVRDGWHAPRPWITLAAGTLLTGFVSYERVRAGEHFPTDVLVGSMAGASIGVLVPHFHRRAHYHGTELEAPPRWIGYAPVTGGGALTFGGML